MDIPNIEKYTQNVSSRKTERGEFLKLFASKINKPIGYVAMRLKGIPTEDLYFIQKQCDQYKGEWAKCFYGMLKVKENPQQGVS